MPGDNILVLVIDGLRAAALGAYGNTTFPTPALDRFAAESFLLDFAFADTTDLPAAYRAFWQSLHPLRPASMNASTLSLPRLLAAQGYHTMLITDDPAMGSYDGAAAFDECLQLDGTATVRADDFSQTCLARLLVAGCEAIRSSNSKPRLIWVHSRGMFGPWDAPLEHQASLLDREEGDPEPYQSIEPPDFSLASAHDPDAAYAIGCAYAGQVMVLDECIEMVRQCLLELPSEERWLATLLGSRGFALGEHGRVGGCDAQLLAEVVHVPMLWRFPDRTGALARSHRLASHRDLVPTLIHWIGNKPATTDGLSLLPLARGSASAWRETLVGANDSGQLAIRNSDWCLRRNPPSPNDEEASFELYVRPDDRCEANDVASLCPDVVQHLSEELDRVARQLAEGSLLASPTSAGSTSGEIPL